MKSALLFPVAILFCWATLVGKVKADEEDVDFSGLPMKGGDPWIATQPVEFKFRPEEDLHDFYPTENLRVYLSGVFRAKRELIDVRVIPPLVDTDYFTVKAVLPALRTTRKLAYLKVQQKVFGVVYKTVAESPYFPVLSYRDAVKQGLVPGINETLAEVSGDVLSETNVDSVSGSGVVETEIEDSLIVEEDDEEVEEEDEEEEEVTDQFEDEVDNASEGAQEVVAPFKGK